MSTRLVILGLLREQPLHGYELKQIIEEHMGDWTNIAFGSIYFALRKLEEEGFVEQIATEQEGRRPSRTVYRITDAGREEFLCLLREVWGEVERHYYAIDVGLAFMDALDPAEIESFLRARVAQLRGVVEHLEEHRAEQLSQEGVPPAAAAVFDHSLAHFRAELAWTRDLQAKIEQGVYP
ncbi:MAG: PadR family transcriptional regulator [Anaerolineae bacterium]|nr:PadR family transcriptional regulator [Anaerolineae bacterium]